MSEAESAVRKHVYSIADLREYANAPLVAPPPWLLEPTAENFGLFPARAPALNAHGPQRRLPRSAGSYGRRQERRHGGDGGDHHEHRGRGFFRDEESEVVEDWLAPSAEADSTGLHTHTETVAAFEQWKSQQRRGRGADGAHHAESAAGPEPASVAASVSSVASIVSTTSSATPSSIASHSSGSVPAAVSAPLDPSAASTAGEHADRWDTPLSLPSRAKTSSRFSTFFTPKDERPADDARSAPAPAEYSEQSSSESLPQPGAKNMPPGLGGVLPGATMPPGISQLGSAQGPPGIPQAGHAGPPRSNAPGVSSVPSLPPGIPIRMLGAQDKPPASQGGGAPPGLPLANMGGNPDGSQYPMYYPMMPMMMPGMQMPGMAMPGMMMPGGAQTGGTAPGARPAAGAQGAQYPYAQFAQMYQYPQGPPGLFAMPPASDPAAYYDAKPEKKQTEK